MQKKITAHCDVNVKAGKITKPKFLRCTQSNIADPRYDARFIRKANIGILISMASELNIISSPKTEHLT